MAGWIGLTLIGVAIVVCVYHLITVVGALIKMARDVVDHFHVKHLTELAVGLEIAAIAEGVEPQGCTLPMAVAGAAHKLNDALMSNGYEVGKWNGVAMVRAVLGQGDNLARLRAELKRAGAREV